MSKGKISDIKPGMLVKLEGSVGPDLGLVYHADTDIFNVLLLNNSGENVPTRVDFDEIICAWNLSQLSTYVMSDLLQGRASGWTTALDNAVVYRSTRPEAVELTLEEISELVSKQLGKPVSVSVKDSKSEGVEPRTEVFVVPKDGAIARDAQIGEEFEIKGVRYRAVEDDRCLCRYCDLEEDDLCGRLGACSSGPRSDGKSIVFKRISTQLDDEQKPTIVTEIHNLYDTEPAIGDIIDDNGKKLKVVESDLGCDVCYFCDDDIDNCKHIICARRHRKDGKNIVLQEVEEE